MADHPANKIGILYRGDAYQVAAATKQPDGVNAPRGLMGRHVAGKEFLDAYLRHGKWNEVVAVVNNRSQATPLVDFCESHPSSRRGPRRLQLVERSHFQESFCGPSPAATMLYFPCPPESQFVWARHGTASHGFAVSGVTHTLASLPSIASLHQLVTAPFESYDRLICTSRAVAQMVRTVTDVYSDYLYPTGDSGNRKVGLEVIPLGVNTQKFRPASDQERAAARARLGIAADETAILFVGRLSHHAKAHPFPLFRGVAEAAQATQQKLHLIVAGWAVSDAVQNAFVQGAESFAPGVRTSFVDGMDSALQSAVWQAADIFTSLVDNIQETFGLVILEAMASGLPVIASDWNGYRDLVSHEQTGALIPTTMVRDATASTTGRLVTGEINYDHFLAECNQTVAVDVRRSAAALTQLVADPALRKRFGEAGRQRAVDHFDWQHVIRQYETLWQEQDMERRSVKTFETSQPRSSHGPPAYPAPEQSFAGYPTEWLCDEDWVRSEADASAQVGQLCSLPLTNYESHRRCDDVALLQSILKKASEGQTIRNLSREFADAGIDREAARATIAWLLKYDLLRPDQSPNIPVQHEASTDENTQLCFVTTCMGRLSALKQSLPRMLRQANSSVVVVDYSCPERAGDWVEANFADVRVVRCPGHDVFHRSAAKNAGAFAATTPWICLIDADVLLHEDFGQRVIPTLRTGRFYRASTVGEGTGGTIICSRDAFEQVGGHDLSFEGWGEEDDDLRDALRFAGNRERYFSPSLLDHLDHGDDLRIRFHENKERHASHMVNRIYRAAKWDLARLRRTPLDDQEKSTLYQTVSAKVQHSLQTGETVELRVPAGSLNWAPCDLGCERTLRYELQPPQEERPEGSGDNSQ